MTADTPKTVREAVGGCAHAGCVLGRPGGVAPASARCTCDERTLRRAVLWLRRRYEVTR